MSDNDATRTALPEGSAARSVSPTDATAAHAPSDGTGTFSPDAAGSAPDVAGSVTVPGYELLDELGRGGMGVVYKARDTRLNRMVALKMIRRDERTGTRQVVRFLAEAEAIAAIRHPHVVRVYEFGEAGGRPFISFEYLPGGSLADRLGAPMPPRAAAELLGQIASGVVAAHEQGIVHRDVKPGNVLFDAAGAPIVTDFGLAKRNSASDLTATQAVMGTPAYMSPEQAGGNAKFVGPQADVWALGVILYEALTGARPFAGEDVRELLAQVILATPAAPRRALPSIPRDLELICLKCLSKLPHERYPTAKELADDLGRFARGEPISVRPAGPLERGYKWVKRNSVVSGAAAAVFLALFVGSGLSLGFGLEARNQAEQARRKQKDADEAAERERGEAARADRERDAALDAQDDLKRANSALVLAKKNSDQHLAKALLAPFFVQDDWTMAPYELEALWRLTESRREEVAWMLLEEATRTALSMNQIDERGEYVLHAAIGLDSRRRDATDQLLLSRLQDPKTPEDQAIRLAEIAAQSQFASPTTAALAARVLIRALSTGSKVYTYDYRSVAALQSVIQRAEPKQQGDICFAYAQAILAALDRGKQNLAHLADSVVWILDRITPTEKAQICPRAAARIFRALNELQERDHTWQALVLALCAVSKESPPIEAADALLWALNGETDEKSLLHLREALADVVRRLPPSKAAEVGIIVTGTLITSGVNATAQAEIYASTLESSLANVIPASEAVLESVAWEIGFSAWLPSEVGSSRGSWWDASVARAERMSEAEASRTLIRLTDALASQSDRYTPGYHLAPLLLALTRRVDRALALRLLLKTLDEPVSNDVRHALARVVAALSNQLSPSESVSIRCAVGRKILGSLVEGNKLDRTPGNLGCLVGGFVTENNYHGPFSYHYWEVASFVTGASVSGRGSPQSLFSSLALLHPHLHPQPLPPQELVELLKQPFCVEYARNDVLDALAFTYNRPFKDLWEFVEYAQTHQPQLDLLSPPKRPQTQP